jgi:hypothetical protein
VKCGSWLFTRDIPDFPDCVVEGRNLLEALDGTRKKIGRPISRNGGAESSASSRESFG